MARKLQRRSLNPAKAAEPAPVFIPNPEPLPAPQPENDPELTVRLLTDVPGIGKTVAQRVLDVAPTVGTLWGRWETAGEFAGEIKGLSAAGASKIWDKVRDTWPALAPGLDGETPSAAPSPALQPAQPAPATGTALVNELHQRLVDQRNVQWAGLGGAPALQDLPSPYDTFSVDQLRILQPTLSGTIAKQVGEYLEWISPSEDADEDVEPTLPDGFQDFNVAQLMVLVSTLSGQAKMQVEAYLAWHEKNHEVTPPAPAVSVPTVKKSFLEPGPAATTTKATSGLLDFFKGEASRYGGGGGKTSYAKLTSGRNVIRLLGPYKPGSPPFRVFKVHTYRMAGRKPQFALDYNWLRTDKSLLRYLLEEGHITEQDVSAAQTKGDPLQELPIRLSQADRKEEAKNLWARTRYLWNIINRATGEHQVWESSKTFFDQIASFDDGGNMVGGLLSVYPDLFDNNTGRDLQINGNGQEGKARRYAAPIALEPSPSGIPADAKMFDLDAIIARKAKPWSEKAEALFSLSGGVANSVGMTPQEWLGGTGQFVSGVPVVNSPVDDDDDIPF